MSVLNSPLAIESLNAGVHVVNVWSKTLFTEALATTQLKRFAGSGPNNVFQIVTDLEKGAGDEIRIDLLKQETSLGVNSNTLLKGSAEQTLSYQQMVVNIDQKRVGMAHYRMSQQRSLHDLRGDAMMVMRDWWARTLDEWMMWQLVGSTPDTPYTTGMEADATAFNTLVVVDADHTDATDAAVVLDTDALDRVKWAAASVTLANGGPVRPVRVDGQDRYIMFIDYTQAEQLQADATYNSAQRDAQLRGSNNPIFTGALGEWNGIVLHASAYIPTLSTGDPTHYGILCGQQAGVIAFGNSVSRLDGVSRSQDSSTGFPMFWAEELEDYGNEVGIASGMIFGIRGSAYDSNHYGRFTLQTGLA